MAAPQYGHRIITALIKEIPHYTGKSLVAHNGELDADGSLGYHCISRPMSFDHVHAHDFPEMLCFIGGNPLDITDLGADVEFTLAGETYPIRTATVVSIPAGIPHCPIKITRVTRPFVFLEISLTRIWKPDPTSHPAP